MTYAVYKVSGPNTNKVYYAYAEGDGTNVFERFIASSKRKSGIAGGDAMLVTANNDDPGSLVAQVVEMVENEYEAYVMRNNLRAADPFAITGPTLMPTVCNARASKEIPEVTAKWTHYRKIAKAKTARDAYALGAWDFKTQIKLANVAPGDLDKLKPLEFAVKYNLPFNLTPPVQAVVA